MNRKTGLLLREKCRKNRQNSRIKGRVNLATVLTLEFVDLECKGI